jgi:steroid delta-isomerase-like uncharacterized protein
LNQEANKATYLRLVEAYNRHDIDTVVACYAADGVHHEPFTTPPDFVGRDSIRRFNQELIASFPDERVEPRRLFADGAWVFAICHCTATHSGEFLGMKPTQRRFAVDECAVLEFDDAALIKNFWVYVDSGLIARQLGFGFVAAESSGSKEGAPSAHDG